MATAVVGHGVLILWERVEAKAEVTVVVVVMHDVVRTGMRMIKVALSTSN